MDSKGVKLAIKNMLIQFLYECGGVDTIPNSRLDALSIINEISSHRAFSKVLIEEQVEGLNMSATIKQILLDHTPGDKFDEDFADAYMEELVESDDRDIFDDDDDEEEEEEEEVFLTDVMHGVQIRLNDFNERYKVLEIQRRVVVVHHKAMEKLAKLEGLDLSSDDVSYLTGDSSRAEHAEHIAVDPKGKHVSFVVLRIFDHKFPCHYDDLK
ncbi:hypothetical protein Cgig2_006530 [Carnegiea gigantea]|uniref:Uncharacterized protein n=1 Tax=Carnegiea gigantea TaxID=171969 RepID=A0A9Q1GXD7_9CARY|nr:hypothetical protein Cgig2_006530 [Carnegiea gigantea]